MVEKTRVVWSKCMNHLDEQNHVTCCQRPVMSERSETKVPEPTVARERPQNKDAEHSFKKPELLSDLYDLLIAPQLFVCDIGKPSKACKSIS